MFVDRTWALFAIGLGFAAFLPWPGVSGPSTWFAWVALITAAFLAHPIHMRGLRFIAWSGVIFLSVVFLAHGVEMLILLPWFFGAVIVFLLGRQTLASRERKSALVLLLSAATAWHLFLSWRSPSIPGADVIGDVLGRERAQGAFATPNIFGAFIILWLPLSFELAFWGDRSKWIFILSSVLGVLGLGATGSLGASFSLCIVSMGMMWCLKRVTKLWALLGTLLLSIALGWVMLSRQLTFLFSENGQDVLTGRFKLWLPALRVFSASPWFGLGPASAQLALAQTGALGEDPHALPLWVGLRFGLFGMLALVGALWILFGILKGRLTQSNLGDGSWGIFLGLLASLIQSLGEMSYSFPLVPLLAFTSLGALFGSSEARARISVPASFDSQSQSFIFNSWAMAFLGTFACLWWGGLQSWQAPLLFGALIFAILGDGSDQKNVWPQTPVERLVGLASIAIILLSFMSVSPGHSLSLSVTLAAFGLWWMRLRRNPWPWGFTLIVFFELLGYVAAVLLLGGMLWTNLGVVSVVRNFFPNQNLFGSIFLVPAFFAGLWRLQKEGYRAATVLGIVVVSLAILACGSRGVLLTVTLTSFWVCARLWSVGNGPRAALLYGSVVLLLCAGTFFSPSSRLNVKRAPTAAQDVYRYERLEFWRHGVALSFARPWTGWGLGNFKVAMRTRDYPSQVDNDSHIGRYRLYLEHAHNEFIELGAELGLPVLGLVIFGVGMLLFAFWRTPTLDPNALFYESVIVAWLVHAQVDFPFRVPLTWSLTVMLLAQRFPVRAYFQAGPFLRRMTLVLIASLAFAHFVGVWLNKRAEHTQAIAKVALLDRQSLLLAPLDAPAWNNRASRALHQGQDPRWLLRKALAKKETLGNDPSMDLALYRLCLAAAPFYRNRVADPIESLLEDHTLIQNRFLALSTEHALVLQARFYLQRTLTQWTTFAPAWLELARLEHKLGLEESASESLQRCLVLEPKFAGALEMLIRAPGKTGKKEVAFENHVLSQLLELRKLRGKMVEPYEISLIDADWNWIDKQLKQHGLLRP